MSRNNDDNGTNKRGKNIDSLLNDQQPAQNSRPNPKSVPVKEKREKRPGKEKGLAQRLAKYKNTDGRPKTQESPEKERKRTSRIKKNMTAMVVIFVLMFVSLIGYSSYSMAMYGSKWFASPYNTRVRHQKDSITPGSIYDRNGLEMASADASGNRTYPQSTEARYANAHIMGDQYGITSGGAEALYSKYIYGFNLNVVDRIVQAFKAQKNKGNDITLTVDSDLNKYIYEAMGSNTGAVVVMNYKTGEIMGSVSRESFDIRNIKDLPQDTGNFLVNKATMGTYPPGSTFKLLTTVSALENLPDATNRKYNSSSDVTISGSKITNFDGDSHGQINLSKALEVSSNTYFAQLATDLGKSKLTATAEKFGFNTNFTFDDVIMKNSSYNGGKTDNQLAWSAVGQHQDIVTPLHMCMVISSIANDGVMMEPKTLSTVKDSLGMSIYSMRSKKYKTVTTPEIANQVTTMMKGVVDSGTGRNAKVNGLSIAGKTGSAETGKSTHAWFVGFIDDESTPYAVAIVLENAGTGGKNAAPLAKKIFSRMTNK